MGKYLFLLFLALGLQVCKAQDIFMSKKAEISFFSEARLEDIEAVSKEAQCVLNVATKELIVKVKIKTFHFTNGLMEEHFNETYLESDKYPDAIFKGLILEKIDKTINKDYNITALGTLTLHGISEARTITGKILVKDGVISLIAEFLIPVSDYKIDIPNDKLSNISQDIKIKINSRNEPFSKSK